MKGLCSFTWRDDLVRGKMAGKWTCRMESVACMKYSRYDRTSHSSGTILLLYSTIRGLIVPHEIIIAF